MGGGRCGGTLPTVEALEVGTDPAADAGLGAGLKPIVTLADCATRAALGRPKALTKLGLVMHAWHMGRTSVMGWWESRRGDLVLLVD